MNSLGLCSKARLIKIGSVKITTNAKYSLGPTKKGNDVINIRGLPFRSCIYYRAGEVLIDLLSIDKSGKIFIEKKYRIANESFEKYVQSCVLKKDGSKGSFCERDRARNR